MKSGLVGPSDIVEPPRVPSASLLLIIVPVRHSVNGILFSRCHALQDISFGSPMNSLMTA